MKYIIKEKIQQFSKGDLEVSLYQKIIKLSEEVGEVSQAFLKYDGSRNTSASANGSPMDVIEECCDTINVACDIINSIVSTNHNILFEDVSDMFNTKLDKWESKQKKYTQPTENVDEKQIFKKLSKKGILIGSRVWSKNIKSDTDYDICVSEKNWLKIKNDLETISISYTVKSHSYGDKYGKNILGNDINVKMKLDGKNIDLIVYQAERIKWATELNEIIKNQIPEFLKEQINSDKKVRNNFVESFFEYKINRNI